MASTVVIDELNADEKPNPGAYESLAKIQEEFWNHWTSLPRPFQKVFGLWFQPKVIWDVFSDCKKNSLQEKHFFTFYQHHFIPNYRNFEGHTTSTLPVNEAFWESGSLPLDAFELVERQVQHFETPAFVNGPEVRQPALAQVQRNHLVQVILLSHLTLR